MQVKQFAVFASGGGSNFQTLIDATQSGEISANICCLIAGKADIGAIDRAKKADIPVRVVQKKDYPTADGFDKAILNALQESKADFAVLAGYLSIIGPQTVKAFKNKMINIHPALIPSFCGMGYYGQHVHRAVVEAGVKISGVTIHFVDETADTGPIIMQQSVPVRFEDTAEQVAERVLELEHSMLPSAVALMAEGKLKVEKNRVKILDTGGK